MRAFDKLKKELKDEGRRQLEDKLTFKQPSESLQKILTERKMANPQLEIEQRLTRIEQALYMLARRSLTTPEDLQHFEKILGGQISITQDQN